MVNVRDIFLLISRVSLRFSTSKKSLDTHHFFQHLPAKVDFLNAWDKVFKNGLSKTCGRQPLKNLK